VRDGEKPAEDTAPASPEPAAPEAATEVPAVKKSVKKKPAAKKKAAKKKPAKKHPAKAAVTKKRAKKAAAKKPRKATKRKRGRPMMYPDKTIVRMPAGWLKVINAKAKAKDQMQGDYLRVVVARAIGKSLGEKRA